MSSRPILTPPRGLLADFLIGPDGTIVALKYGDAYDQWSVDELLAHAGAAVPVARKPPLAAVS